MAKMLIILTVYDDSEGKPVEAIVEEAKEAAKKHGASGCDAKMVENLHFEDPD